MHTDLDCVKSLAVANNVMFRNCLVTMQPTVTKADLPTTHDITTYIHNAFATFLQDLKTELQVSHSLIVANYCSLAQYLCLGCKRWGHFNNN